MPLSCKTYISVSFDIDIDLNAEFIRKGIDPTPEQLGIKNKTEVENALRLLTSRVYWQRHSFIVGFNDEYDVDVNIMLRKTIGSLFDKSEELRNLQQHFGVHISLVAVPEISCSCKSPTPILSLDPDIVEFLYKSRILHDLDYYISE